MIARDTGLADIAPGSSLTFAPITLFSMTDSLVAWWSFDEGVGEIVGDRFSNGIDGVVRAGKWIEGRSGYAIDVGAGSVDMQENSEDYFDIAAGQKFCISMGVAIDGTETADTPRRIICKTEPNMPSFELVLNPDGTISFRIRNAGTQMQWVSVDARKKIADGEWRCVVAGRNGEKLFVFIDGEKAGERVTGEGDLANASPLILGAGNNTSTELMMAIDCVRFYKRMLVDEEIGYLAR